MQFTDLSAPNNSSQQYGYIGTVYALPFQDKLEMGARQD